MAEVKIEGNESSKLNAKEKVLLKSSRNVSILQNRLRKGGKKRAKDGKRFTFRMCIVK